MALTWAYKRETLPIDETTDVVIDLPVPAGGTQWAAGTTATLTIYAAGATFLTVPLTVEPAGITGRIESEVCATIPRGATFKLWASAPAEGEGASTEIPLYAGAVERSL